MYKIPNYKEFSLRESECDKHNIAEAIKLMEIEIDGNTRQFNKYKRFIKDTSKRFLGKWQKPLQWTKEYETARM
jgi:hypothetical protein